MVETKKLIVLAEWSQWSTGEAGVAEASTAMSFAEDELRSLILCDFVPRDEASKTFWSDVAKESLRSDCSPRRIFVRVYSDTSLIGMIDHAFMQSWNFETGAIVLRS